MSQQEDRLEDPEWLRERYWEDGMSVQDIADKLGEAHGVVYNRFMRYNIERRSQSGVNDERLRDEQWLREQHWDEDMTLGEMADVLDCSTMTVANHMEDLGVERQDPGTVSFPKLHDEESARGLYEEHGSVNNVAEALGCSDTTAYRWLKTHGVVDEHEGPIYDELTGDALHSWAEEGYKAVDIAEEVGCSVATVHHHAEKHGLKDELRSHRATPDELKDEEWLRQRYKNEGMSTGGIAELVDRGRATISYWLRKHDIETRGRGASTENMKHQDPDWLEEQLREKGKSYSEVAEETGVTQNTIRHWARKHMV
jgi:transposase